MALCVVDHVEIDEFLELEVGGLHVLHDAHEEHRDVFASGHGVDDSADGLEFELLVVRV